MEESRQKQLTVIGELSERFNFLVSADGAVESKAGVLLGFEVVIGFAFWSDKLFHLSDKKMFLGALGVLFLLVSIYYLIRVILWPQKYASGSVYKNNLKEVLDLSEKEMLEKIIHYKEQANTENASILSKKVKSFKDAIIYFGLAMSLLVVSTSPQICF
jgi:hypothetical protein